MAGQRVRYTTLSLMSNGDTHFKMSEGEIGSDHNLLIGKLVLNLKPRKAKVEEQMHPCFDIDHLKTLQFSENLSQH